MASEEVRKLGRLECYHLYRHTVKFDTCINLAARYNLPILQTNLFPALEKVAQSHGALCVRVEGEATKRPTYHRLKVLDFTKIVRFAAKDTSWSTSLGDVLQSELLQPFDISKLPLWRLVVLGDNTIVFSVHHCIGDGMSTVAFHRALLATLNETRSSPAPSTLEPMTVPSLDEVKRKLEHPAEQVTKVSPPLHNIAKMLRDELAPSWMKKSNSTTWTGNLVNLDANPLFMNEVRILEFSSSDMGILSRLCKEHHTTITPVLYLLAISSISQALLEDSKSFKYKSVSTFIPMSIRRHCNVSDDVLCDYATTYEQNTLLDAKKSPAQLWVEAAQLTSKLHLTDNRGIIGLLKFLFGRYNEYYTDKVGKKRGVGFEISNVGRANIPTLANMEGAWRIDKMAFCQGDPVIGAALKMNVVGTPDGSLGITITWSETAVSTAIAERFINQFQNEMATILLTGKPS